MRIHAVIASAERPVLVAGPSAAALWGMPIAGAWPRDVTVLDQWRGGGRSEPGVRRVTSGHATAASVTIGGVAATSLPRTALDVARRKSLVDAIGSVDWALWRNNPHAVDRADLLEECARVSVHAGRRALESVVAFATHLSDSFGESASRAAMHGLGFQIPELQVVFRDAEGKIILDYYWRGVNVGGEFDGKVKFTRNEFTGGDPGEVAWREKKREDRVRRQVAGVVRILDHDVRNPHRLEALLREAGIPRVDGR